MANGRVSSEVCGQKPVEMLEHKVPATCVRICICSCNCCNGSRYSDALPALTSSSLESIWANLSLYNLQTINTKKFHPEEKENLTVLHDMENVLKFKFFSFCYSI